MVWCKRDDALDLTDATPEEQNELVMILQDLKTAVTNVFQADWFNFTFLGNGTRHLHCHFVPRYAAPRIHMGITFKDTFYGNNYKTDHDFRIPEEMLRSIQQELITALQGT